jgi:tetratricopeptide (TPR) repeat protein
MDSSKNRGTYSQLGSPASSACSSEPEVAGAPVAAPYQSWMNHAACLQHRGWWRDPKLLVTFLALAITAVLGSSYAFVSSGDVSSSEKLSSFVPLFSRSNFSGGDLRQSEFRALYRHGQELVRDGRLEPGIRHYQQAERLTGVDGKSQAELYNDMAVAHHAAGRENESIRYFQRAIEADPSMVAAYNNLAMAFMQQGEFDKARGTLKCAAKVEPNNDCAIKRLRRFFGVSTND